MKPVTATVLATLLLAASTVRAAELKSPEETYKGYPTRVADIPAGWATTKPLRLQICFNLKHAVNSPEANQFLLDLQRTITAMPYGVKVRVERAITPARFAYCASLSFRNWENNRAYENSEVFLKYYREQWKPVVTESSEQLLVLDEVASGP